MNAKSIFALVLFAAITCATAWSATTYTYTADETVTLTEDLPNVGGFKVTDAFVTIDGCGHTISNTAGATLQVGANSTLVFSNVAFHASNKFTKPSFPADGSGLLVFKDIIGSFTIGTADNNVPAAFTKILLDNATNVWKANFSRSAGGITRGWEIRAQNKASFSTSSGFAYMGSGDPDFPIRFIALSGSKINIAAHSFYWTGGGVEMICSNATLIANAGNCNGTWISQSRFILDNGEMTGQIGLKSNVVANISGPCTGVPSFKTSATVSHDNVVSFKDVRGNAGVPNTSAGGWTFSPIGTNNIVVVDNSQLTNATAMKVYIGGADAYGSRIEFRGANPKLVLKGQSGKTVCNFPTSGTDLAELRFVLPAGGFPEPVLVGGSSGNAFVFSPIQPIRVDVGEFKYTDQEQSVPLVGRGPCSWSATPDVVSLANYATLPKRARLALTDSNANLSVILPPLVSVTAAYWQGDEGLSATLSFSAIPDAEVHCVSGMANGGTVTSDWANDVTLPTTASTSTSYGPVAGLGTAFRFMRFYVVNGDGTKTWSNTYEATANPQATSRTAFTNSCAARLDLAITSTGLSSREADVFFSFGPANGDFGAETLVAQNVTDNTVVKKAVAGLTPETGYKYKFRVVNSNDGEVEATGTFATTAAPADPPATPEVEMTSLAAEGNGFVVDYSLPWTGGTTELADVTVAYGLTENMGSEIPAETSFVGAGSLAVADLKPGALYHVCVKAVNGSSAEAVSATGTVTIASSAIINSATSVETASGISILYDVTPGLGENKIYLLYAFNDDDYDHVVELDGSTYYIAPTSQKGDTLHWQIVVSNAYTSATWGASEWGVATGSEKRAFPDYASRAWTWCAEGGTGDWQCASNWTASDSATGFPNAPQASATFTTDTNLVSHVAMVKDDVTLSSLTIGDTDVALKGNGDRMNISGAITYGGARLTFDNVVVTASGAGGNGRPIHVGGNEKPGEFAVVNGAKVDFTATTDRAAPAAGSTWRVSGEGSSLRLAGNAERWGRATDNKGYSIIAENGGRFSGEAFFYLLSSDPAHPARLTADGGTLIVGSRTYFGSNLVVTVKNGGVLATGDGKGNDKLVDSTVFVADGSISCPIPLGSGNSVVFTSSTGTGTNALSSYGAYFANETSRENSVMVSNCVLTGGQVLLYGTNNTIVIDNAAVATSYQPVFTSTNAKGTKLVFRGDAPSFKCSWQTSNMGAAVGSDTSSDGLPLISFELGALPYAEAPFQPSTIRNSRVYEHLPLEVKAGSNWRGRKRDTIPLMRFHSVYGTKPEADAIESHLAADALPTGAHLLWQGDVLCVKGVPAQGTTILVLR